MIDRCAAIIAPLMLVSFFFAGCASFRVGSEIMAGRSALQREEPKVAVEHFERVTQLNPDYVTNFTQINIGAWSYLGRAYYEAGDLPRALKALERARATHKEDHVAKLYLGLVQIRMGRKDEGLRSIETGLRDLRNWLSYVEFYTLDGEFWDPGHRLANATEDILGWLQSPDLSTPKLLSGVEWLGRELDEEIDFVRKDKERFRRGDNGNGKN